MNKALFVFAAIVGCVLATPTRPVIEDFRCSYLNEKVVDAEDMCWYHVCDQDENGNLYTVPMRCALGSRNSYNVINAEGGFCTVNFDSEIGYDCMRAQSSYEGAPPCVAEWEGVCQNDGVVDYESEMCWCKCPPTWQGDYDCSKPTRDPTGLDAGSNICVDGEPLEDWCATDPQGGCQNGGTCFNQCDTFWCDCPEHETHDYVGKRCELKGQ